MKPGLYKCPTCGNEYHSKDNPKECKQIDEITKNWEKAVAELKFPSDFQNALKAYFEAEMDMDIAKQFHRAAPDKNTSAEVYRTVDQFETERAKLRKLAGL